MNTRDMKITLKDYQLCIDYTAGMVASAMIDAQTSEITFIFRDGRKNCINISCYVEIDTVYLKQFGLTVTSNGEIFFIQSWERGLFCFDTASGTLLWHNDRKKAYELVALREVVVCRFMNHGIEVIDINKGNTISYYPLGSNTIFIPIDDEYYLVGPKRDIYRVLDYNLKETIKLPLKLLNPSQFDTFIIRDAQFTNDGMQIMGFEYFGGEMRRAIREHKVDDFLSKALFTRSISFVM